MSDFVFNNITILPYYVHPLNEIHNNIKIHKIANKEGNKNKTNRKI